MSRIRFVTLTDFMSRGFMVRIGCRSCGHARQLDPTGLCHLFLRRGWSTRLHHAQKIFRCTKCRMKNCEIVPGSMIIDRPPR